MDPLTLMLLFGGAFALFGRKNPAASLPAIQQMLNPNMTNTSVIQYTDHVPPPSDIFPASAVMWTEPIPTPGHNRLTDSPIVYSGYIPPYQATPGASAVALGALRVCKCQHG